LTAVYEHGWRNLPSLQLINGELLATARSAGDQCHSVAGEPETGLVASG
jgi:hypothetical protein